MEKLINLIIFSLLISNVAKSEGSNVDITRVLSELKDIVGQLEKDNQKKNAEMKDFKAKDDVEFLDELKFEAEIQSIIQSGKSQDKESVNRKDALEPTEEHKLEAELRRLMQNEKTANCKNAKTESHCLEAFKNERCLDEDVRTDCPRTCMKCCADIDSNLCKERRRYCHKTGSVLTRMRHLCPKTCGYCGKGHAPPPCMSSVFGCCWDKSTPASASIGSGRENCPACVDKRSSRLCNRFQRFCEDFNPDRKIGRQMRSLCPKTCRVCGPKARCMDDPAQKENCPRYKRTGDCKTNENGMRYWCPKTCGFCK